MLYLCCELFFLRVHAVWPMYRWPDSQPQHMYQLSSTEVGCEDTCIGHTACTLRKRSSRHKYSISAIHKHYINGRLLSCVPVIFSDNFIVLQNFPVICELRIAEVILIKEKSHIINVKYNEMYNSLNFYK